MARKTKEEAAETRERILDAALDIFSQQGYSQTTFVDIADRIGMTKGAIYWHFKDKPELLAALIEKMREREERLVAERVPEVSTIEDLRDYFMARTRVVSEDEAVRKFVLFMMLQMEWSVETRAAVREEMQKVRREPFDDIERILRKLRRRGVLRKDIDLNTTKHILMGLWFGLLSTHLHGLGAADFPACVETGFNMLIEGIRASQPS